MKSNTASIALKTGLVAAILLPLLNGLDAKPQNSDRSDNSNVAARLICYEVKPEFQEVFRKSISEYILYSRRKAGNILSEAYHEQYRPSMLWIIERWDNLSELDKISRSHQYKTIDSLSKIGTLQAPKTMYVKDLEPLSKERWRSKANKEDRPITIMLFVDSKQGTENEFRKVYHSAMPPFRAEVGVINYQLSRFEDDSSRFVTYEKFRNEDAFKYHLNFPPIKPVIEYLNTSIKVQPFQTGLHRLVEFVPMMRE